MCVRAWREPSTRTLHDAALDRHKADGADAVLPCKVLALHVGRGDVRNEDPRVAATTGHASGACAHGSMRRATPNNQCTARRHDSAVPRTLLRATEGIRRAQRAAFIAGSAGCAPVQDLLQGAFAVDVDHHVLTAHAKRARCGQAQGARGPSDAMRWHVMACDAGAQMGPDGHGHGYGLPLASPFDGGVGAAARWMPPQRSSSCRWLRGQPCAPVSRTSPRWSACCWRASNRWRILRPTCARGVPSPHVGQPIADDGWTGALAVGCEPRSTSRVASHLERSLHERAREEGVGRHAVLVNAVRRRDEVDALDTKLLRKVLPSSERRANSVSGKTAAGGRR
jgi:hypothetical protein